VAGLALVFFGLSLVFGSTILYLSGNQEFIRTLGSMVLGMPTFFLMVLVGAVASILGLFISRRDFNTLRKEQERRAMTMIEQDTSGLFAETSAEDFVTLPEIPLAGPYADEASTPRQETPSQEAPEVSPNIVMLKVVSRGVDEVCPHCGGVNNLKVTKCSSCGREIFTKDDSQPSCPVCGAPIYAIPGGGGRVICNICFSEMDAVI